MKNLIYLRALHPDDAKISYAWRNNPLIWKYTKFRAKRQITYEIESEWISDVLKRHNERRFAICLKDDGRYIGNVQLIDIKEHSAEFHLFIGDVSFWGKGIGKEATDLILQFGFLNLNLDSVDLQVHRENLAAIAIYKKMGFVVVNDSGEFIDMEIQKDNYQKLIVPIDLSDVSTG